jgi:hypothetical protein
MKKGPASAAPFLLWSPEVLSLDRLGRLLDRDLLRLREVLSTLASFGMLILQHHTRWPSRHTGLAASSLSTFIELMLVVLDQVGIPRRVQAFASRVASRTALPTQRIARDAGAKEAMQWKA